MIATRTGARTYRKCWRLYYVWLSCPGFSSVHLLGNLGLCHVPCPLTLTVASSFSQTACSPSRLLQLFHVAEKSTWLSGVTTILTAPNGAPIRLSRLATTPLAKALPPPATLNNTHHSTHRRRRHHLHNLTTRVVTGTRRIRMKTGASNQRRRSTTLGSLYSSLRRSVDVFFIKILSSSAHCGLLLALGFCRTFWNSFERVGEAGRFRRRCGKR